MQRQQQRQQLLKPKQHSKQLKKLQGRNKTQQRQRQQQRQQLLKPKQHSKQLKKLQGRNKTQQRQQMQQLQSKRRQLMKPTKMKSGKPKH